LESTAQQVGVRELLEAGVHFGHQARRWNPKMKKYIFAERAGVHIIDLDQTLELLEEARKFVRSVAEADREVLFVGTKKQAQLTIAEQAIRCGMPYVAERYIGGMLTNFQTIHGRILYFKELMAQVEATPEEERTGREWFALQRNFQKMRRNFAGISEMERLPQALFVVDPKREEMIIKEANRLKIPVVAITDTNCDPEVVDYVIPGNDDAIRSINLITRVIADAILEGKSGSGEVPTDRPVPPVVEEAQVGEEVVSIAAQQEVAPAQNGGGEPAPEPLAAAGAETSGEPDEESEVAPEVQPEDRKAEEAAEAMSEEQPEAEEASAFADPEPASAAPESETSNSDTTTGDESNDEIDEEK
jgi:small subunit ribosomal protein S2